MSLASGFKHRKTTVQWHLLSGLVLNALVPWFSLKAETYKFSVFYLLSGILFIFLCLINFIALYEYYHYYNNHINYYIFSQVSTLINFKHNEAWLSVSIIFVPWRYIIITSTYTPEMIIDKQSDV